VGGTLPGGPTVRGIALAVGAYCILYALATALNLTLLLGLALCGRWANATVVITGTPFEIYVETPALAALTLEVVLAGILAWDSRGRQ
jgi:dolichyl-phosphate-mannose--protein O-mannosyl transferase